MAIEVTDTGITITGEHIALHQGVALAHALALEVNTGMRASRGRSAMQAANAVTGRLDRVGLNEWLAGRTRSRIPVLTAGTKRGALVGLTTYLMIVWGWEPLPSTTKALGKDADKILRRARAIRAVVVADGGDGEDGEA